MSKLSRRPCPYRILDDTGGAFVIGYVGTMIFRTFKSIYHIRTFNKRQYFFDMISSSRNGISFGYWGFFFSIYDCAYASMRKKEDIFNSIMAGAACGATLSVGYTAKSAMIQGFFGACILGAIEGVSMFIENYFQKQQMIQLEKMRGISTRKILEPPTPTMKVQDIHIDESLINESKKRQKATKEDFTRFFGQILVYLDKKLHG